MAFQQLNPFLAAQLPQNLSNLLSQSTIQGLSPVLGNDHYVVFNVINLADRFVLEEEFSCRDFMLSGIFPSRSDRFYGSLKNAEKISYQLHCFRFGSEKQ